MIVVYKLDVEMEVLSDCPGIGPAVLAGIMKRSHYSSKESQPQDRSGFENCAS